MPKRSKRKVEKIEEIDLHDIDISDLNVRKHQADNGDLDDLAASIREFGLLQPVILLPDGPPYRLIVGQRRYLAHKKLGWTKIKARFAPKKDSTPLRAKTLSLVENVHRTELNHADAAEAVTDLFRRHGRDDRKVAKVTGLALRRVRECIRIQERASPKMKEQLKKEPKLLPDVKRALKAADGNVKKAERLLDLMQEHQLTGHDKTRVVEYAQAHPKALAATIIEEAQKPRVERSIMVSLDDETREGLQHAVDELAMLPEEVASQALSDWLRAKGFME